MYLQAQKAKNNSLQLEEKSIYQEETLFLPRHKTNRLTPGIVDHLGINHLYIWLDLK